MIRPHLKALIIILIFSIPCFADDENSFDLCAGTDNLQAYTVEFNEETQTVLVNSETDETLFDKGDIYIDGRLEFVSNDYERGFNNALDAIMLLDLELKLKDEHLTWGDMATICRERFSVRK